MPYQAASFWLIRITTLIICLLQSVLKLEGEDHFWKSSGYSDAAVTNGTISEFPHLLFILLSAKMITDSTQLTNFGAHN